VSPEIICYHTPLNSTNFHIHTQLPVKAVITPITVSIGLAFRRREQALYEIRRIRSCAFQIYISHGIWDWGGSDQESTGRVEAGINWLQHTDLVLEQLIGIGDELSRFLTLPTSSQCHHRMMRSGRREATKILEMVFSCSYPDDLGRIQTF